MKLAITFPIFNNLEYTKQCLKSLFDEHKIETQKIKYSVVIVDDNSTDGSGEWIQKNYPQVKLLKGSGNLWWSGGINEAIKSALDELRTDYVLWWNNDIIPRKDYFTNVQDLLENADPKIIFGSKILFHSNPSIIWSMGGEFNTKTGIYRMKGMYCTDGKDFNKPIKCDWLPGMGAIIHRSVFENIGFTDNVNFPQYHGDSDFTFRAKKAGYLIFCRPELVIYNDTRNTGLSHNGSFQNLIESLKTIKSNYNISKELLFYHKHATSPLAKFVVYKRFAKYIGGFFKWKILNSIGLNRNDKSKIKLNNF